jgi:23S rRNA (pseudouridine1915-N3)-methyltransferase
VGIRRRAAAARRERSRGGGAGLILLHIVARGRIGRSPEAELVDRYIKRITWPTRVTELPDRGGKLPMVEPQTRRVLLDESGEMLGSVAFASQLGRWRDDGVREARFMIGAADGFDDAARADADLLLSFGRATWPHLLARAMLAEQLFRAVSILANHPYHREG